MWSLCCLTRKVAPPLAIKTRIHTPTSPAAQLDPAQRSEIYLEVLVQNTSMVGMSFDRVVIEPVKGMISRAAGEPRTGPFSSSLNPVLPSSIVPLSSTQSAHEPFSDDATLYPDDTRQYIFVISPDHAPQEDYDPLPPTTFPTIHSPATILPLGRLDVSWFSAPYRDPGRLQTSTLNRRVPIVPIAPITPVARKNLAIPASPGVASSSVRPLSPVDSLRRGPSLMENKSPGSGGLDWEYDLVITQLERNVEVESEFIAKIRLAARSLVTSSTSDITSPSDDVSTSPPPAPALHLAVQYLSVPPPLPYTSISASSSRPAVSLSGPSRSSTPQSSGPSRHPVASPGPSRPMTPVSTQLRQAASSSLRPQANSALLARTASAALEAEVDGDNVVFPPEPFLPQSSWPTSQLNALQSQAGRPVSTTGTPEGRGEGQVIHLGSSLEYIPPLSLKLVCERVGDSPPANPNARSSISTSDGEGENQAGASVKQKYWEGVHELDLRFVGLQEGLANLGGVRVLLLDNTGVDETMKLEAGLSGSLGREWLTLGDVWVT